LIFEPKKKSGLKVKPQKIIPKKKVTHDQIPKIIKIKFLNKVCIPFKKTTKKIDFFFKRVWELKEGKRKTNKVLAWWISASSSLRDSLKDLPMEEEPPLMYMFPQNTVFFFKNSIKIQQQQVS